MQVFLGARPVVVVADAEVGKKMNMRCPMRPEILGPGLLLTAKDNVLFERGILTVQECALTLLGALRLQYGTKLTQARKASVAFRKVCSRKAPHCTGEQCRCTFEFHALHKCI